MRFLSILSPRRFFRFGMRSVFIGVGAISVLLGLMVRDARRYEADLEAVREISGCPDFKEGKGAWRMIVGYLMSPQHRPYEEICGLQANCKWPCDKTRRKISLETAQRMTSWNHLKYLQFSNIDFAPGSLAVLASCPQLKYCSLSYCSFSKAELAAFHQTPRIELKYESCNATE